MPLDEVILITMFLCYEPQKQETAGKMAILYAFYGEGIASSIVRTISDISKAAIPIKRLPTTQQARARDTR